MCRFVSGVIVGVVTAVLVEVVSRLEEDDSSVSSASVAPRVVVGSSSVVVGCWDVSGVTATDGFWRRTGAVLMN